MMNTFVVYVENKPGVLTRVASLFRRRAFNIDSLTVGRTEKPEVSRMTITAEADRDQARRIEANLYKLVNVLLWRVSSRSVAYCRSSGTRLAAASNSRNASASRFCFCNFMPCSKALWASWRACGLAMQAGAPGMPLAHGVVGDGAGG